MLLLAVDAAFVRDVLPGEIVNRSLKKESHPIRAWLCRLRDRPRCTFEYIYFARTDRTLERDKCLSFAGLPQAGHWRNHYPVEADLVVGVPDSGLVAAKGYSEQSGIPYGMAFHKNSYVGRTFIKPSQSERESSVKIKLNVIPEVVKGKRIIMVDDSIVRGTTCANIIRMLKAREPPKFMSESVHRRFCIRAILEPMYRPMNSL